MIWHELEIEPINYLSSPVSPYDVATVGIPKLFVRDLIASENTPVVVVSRTKSGGVWASIISPSFEHTIKGREISELVFYCKLIRIEILY